MAEVDNFALIVRGAVIWLILSCLLLLYGRRLRHIKKSDLAGFFLRFFAAWLAGSFLTISYGWLVSEALLLHVAEWINILQNDFTIYLRPVPDHANIIHSVGKLHQDILPMTAGTAVPIYINSIDFTMPAVLLFALLCAWPAQTLRGRFFLLAMTLPSVYLYLILSGPFYIAARYESMFQALAKFGAHERAVPLYYRWSLFLEIGGRWLLVLILALTGKYLADRNQRSLEPESTDIDRKHPLLSSNR